MSTTENTGEAGKDDQPQGVRQTREASESRDAPEAQDAHQDGAADLNPNVNVTKSRYWRVPTETAAAGMSTYQALMMHNQATMMEAINGQFATLNAKVDLMLRSRSRSPSVSSLTSDKGEGGKRRSSVSSAVATPATIALQALLASPLFKVVVAVFHSWHLMSTHKNKTVTKASTAGLPDLTKRFFEHASEHFATDEGDKSDECKNYIADLGSKEKLDLFLALSKEVNVLKREEAARKKAETAAAAAAATSADATGAEDDDGAPKGKGKGKGKATARATRSRNKGSQAASTTTADADASQNDSQGSQTSMLSPVEGRSRVGFAPGVTGGSSDLDADDSDQPGPSSRRGASHGSHKNPLADIDEDQE